MAGRTVWEPSHQDSSLSSQASFAMAPPDEHLWILASRYGVPNHQLTPRYL